MASWPDRFEPDQIVARLVGGEVDFVVVGGIAVIAHGYVRLTRDLDITYSLSSENLDRLGDVLVGLNAHLRGVKDSIPFVPDGRTLRRTRILTLDTDLGWFDLIAEPAGAPPYPELKAAAVTIEVAGVPDTDRIGGTPAGDEARRQPRARRCGRRRP